MTKKPLISERFFSLIPREYEVHIDKLSSRNIRIRAEVTRYWCPRGDLNPHTRRHMHLKHTCLPFHHPGKFRFQFFGIYEVIRWCPLQDSNLQPTASKTGTLSSWAKEANSFLVLGSVGKYIETKEFVKFFSDVFHKTDNLPG